MGEYAISSAEKILDRLASYAYEEIILAWGAKGELNKLTATLKTIQVVLLDAEEKQSSDRRISHWLGKLKDVCNDVDDVLDEFEFQKLWISSGASSIKGKVRQFFSEWNSLIFNFKLAHKIKEVRESLEVIAIEKTHYSLAEREGDHWRGLNNNDISERETDSIVVESNVVGRYEDQENVILRLLNEDKGVASHHFMDLGNVCVISIIGLAGFGKTTLAKLVYNDKRVAQNFGMRMWICASNHFDNITLIRGMISAATNRKCDQYQSLDLMKRGLQDALRGDKFLLVLDDICDNESGGVTWKDMKPLLNVCAKGSKILITTRNKSVSLHIGSIYVHQLNALSHSDSMSLFKTSVFSQGDEELHPKLGKIGEDIVGKCRGVPLVVATVGRFLNFKRREKEWLRVKDELWKLKNYQILPALKVSYDIHALPSYLKPCFAFFSLFPKGYQFSSTELVPLWMAQGYLKSSRENEDDFEEIGLRYVRQFYLRALIQLHLYSETLEMQFTMHDLIHDLAISLAQGEFSTVNLRPSDALEKIRHVSIFRNDLSGEEAEAEAQVPEAKLRFDKLRTFVTLDGEGSRITISKSFLRTCISRSKCMRALNLQGLALEEIPSSIGNLSHLRYLNMSGNKMIRKLPSSIYKLMKLQFLYLGGCEALEELPKEIRNLINLRHLELTTQELYLPKGIFRRLNKLQKLSIANCSKLSALPEFTAYGLRELKIQGCPELSKRCTQHSGADWPKIARVPKVEIDGVKLMMNNEGRN